MSTTKYSDSHELERRDWLKMLSLGGLAAITSKAANAQPVSQPSAASKSVRGIVFMVSDGMSPGVLTMAQAFSKQIRGKGTCWWELLNNRNASRGLMDTASANSMVTDSAAASSSWGGGQRVNNGMINISPTGQKIEPIAAILKAKDAQVGLVTTATATHATPAGFAANVNERSNEHSIAEQYLNRVDVVLGGGSLFFDAKTRPDQKDLFGEYGKAGYDVVRDRSALLASRSKKLLGIFSQGHIPYSIDRQQNSNLQEVIPRLEEMAECALSRFLESGKPFLLQVEGARIDHAAHLNDIAALLHEQLAFDDAVAKVLSLVAAHPDVLVIVTSDHGNSNPGLNGMGASYHQSTQCFERIASVKESHESLFFRWSKQPTSDIGEMVRESLGYALRPKQVDALTEVLNKKPVVEWNHQHANPEGLLGQFSSNHLGVGWTGTTHTSDPTLVSAIGPQHKRFSGMVVNTDVFRHFTELLG